MCIAFVPSFYYLIQLISIGAWGFMLSAWFANSVAMKTDKLLDTGIANPN